MAHGLYLRLRTNHALSVSLPIFAPPIKRSVWLSIPHSIPRQHPYPMEALDFSLPHPSPEIKFRKCSTKTRSYSRRAEGARGRVQSWLRPEIRGAAMQLSSLNSIMIMDPAPYINP